MHTQTIAALLPLMAWLLVVTGVVTIVVFVNVSLLSTCCLHPRPRPRGVVGFLHMQRWLTAEQDEEQLGPLGLPRRFPIVAESLRCRNGR